MKKKTKYALIGIGTLLVSSIIYFICNYFCGTYGLVNGISMLPALQDREKFYAIDKSLEYGDIVFVVQDPAYKNYQKDYSSFLKQIFVGDESIKRLIGLPGDTIKVTTEGVYRNGELLDEKYLPEENRLASYIREDDPYLECTLDEGECYVMGDNRAVSVDSRTIGPVQMKNLYPAGTTFTWYSQRFNIFLRIGQAIGLFFLVKWFYLDRKEEKEEKVLELENKEQ